MAKPNHPYTEGEWKGPEKVSTHRLAASPPIGTAGVASPIVTRSRCRSSSWTARSIRRCSGRRASKPNLILPPVLEIRSSDVHTRIALAGSTARRTATLPAMAACGSTLIAR